MSHQSPIHLSVQRFALLTCLVALLPISIGSLVTTLKAGMAFADWPTSDGQNMLLYPWLKDLGQIDKFVEHGHRLAGMLIGFVSIGLVYVTFRNEKSRRVRFGSVLILMAVIAQGLLGGMRVRMDAQVLAMTHSITGGMFFTLCFLFAWLVRRGHLKQSAEIDNRVSPLSFAAGMLLPVAVLSQYVLGGFFRHLGMMLHEHVAGAIVVSILALGVIFALMRSDLADLRRRGRWLGMALTAQLALGIGSWVTKLGLPALGWVATVNSLAQNVVCTLHTVGGMLLLATASAAAANLWLHARAGRLQSLSVLWGTSALNHLPTQQDHRTTGGVA